MLTDTIAERVVTGLAKIGLALKHKTATEAAGEGLSPTQGQILAILSGRGGMRLSELSEVLAVTPATASDAVGALERKGLVTKGRRTEDRRAIRIVLTDRGRRMAKKSSSWPDFLLGAVETMSAEEQAVFLRGLVKMIRVLQERGEIPVARMCVSCRYFREGVHEDRKNPHHCDFVDAAFGDAEVRLDCGDFELVQIKH